MRQSQGKTPNRKNSRIILNSRPGYVIIPCRFEDAAYSASLPGKVKSFIFYCAPFGCAPGQRIIRRRDITHAYFN